MPNNLTMESKSFEFPIIGIIHSCFTEKFGIPRQPQLVPLARARLELLPPYNDPAAVEGLEASSHIWIQFVFHKNKREEWKPKVKPPRLGGNKTLGVFATRSPTRPAPIGLSVVKLDKILIENGKTILEISGVDILDDTPVLDIKPYLPYADSIFDATNEFASGAPQNIKVEFDACTEQCLQGLHIKNLELIKSSGELKELIQQILQQDPRPQYQSLEDKPEYAMRLLNFDLHWRYQSENNGWKIHVTSIQEIK